MYLHCVYIAVYILMLIYVLGEYEYFRSPFEGTVAYPGAIALSFYQGLFAYNGW